MKAAMEHHSQEHRDLAAVVALEEHFVEAQQQCNLMRDDSIVCQAGAPSPSVEIGDSSLIVSGCRVGRRTLLQDRPLARPHWLDVLRIDLAAMGSAHIDPRPRAHSCRSGVPCTDCAEASDACERAPDEPPPRSKPRRSEHTLVYMGASRLYFKT